MFVVEQVCLSPREGTLYAGFPTRGEAAAAAAKLDGYRNSRNPPTIREMPDGAVPLHDPNRPDGWFFEYGLE